MKPLPNELILGDANLDAQHDLLFSLLDAAAKAEAESPAALATLVRAVLHHCVVHFSLEERYMISYGYNKWSNHMSRHAAFKRDCESLCRKVLQADATHSMLTKDLVLKTMRTWITEHILDRSFGDMAFAIWLRAGSGATRLPRVQTPFGDLPQLQPPSKKRDHSSGSHSTTYPPTWQYDPGDPIEPVR